MSSKSGTQREPSLEDSQLPLIVRPSSLNVPVYRCEKSSGEKSGVVRDSFHTPSAKPVSYSLTTPRESK
jgi:hypothetical protein